MTAFPVVPSMPYSVQMPREWTLDPMLWARRYTTGVWNAVVLANGRAPVLLQFAVFGDAEAFGRAYGMPVRNDETVSQGKIRRGPAKAKTK